MKDGMSFGFTIADAEFDRDTHTSRITRVNKLYDVSAVSLPANPDTEISARSYLNGVIEAAKQELLESDRERRARLAAALELAGLRN
jgi:phage head maturation protease